MNDVDERDQPRVERIADLSIEPPAGFPQRVRRGVNRRVLAGDLAHLSFAGIAHAVLQYVIALFGFADQPRADRAGTNDRADSDE